jgi:hypothetical protein
MHVTDAWSGDVQILDQDGDIVRPDGRSLDRHRGPVNGVTTRLGSSLSHEVRSWTSRPAIPHFAEIAGLRVKSTWRGPYRKRPPPE